MDRRGMMDGWKRNDGWMSIERDLRGMALLAVPNFEVLTKPSTASMRNWLKVAVTPEEGLSLRVVQEGLGEW